MEQVQSLLPRAGERKERQRGRRGATQLIGVSGLHIDASHLPFLSLSPSFSALFLSPSGQRKSCRGREATVATDAQPSSTILLLKRHKIS